MSNKIKGFIEIKRRSGGIYQTTLINVEKIINIQMRKDDYGREYTIIACESETLQADESYNSIVEKIRASRFM